MHCHTMTVLLFSPRYQGRTSHQQESPMSSSGRWFWNSQIGHPRAGQGYSAIFQRGSCPVHAESLQNRPEAMLKSSARQYTSGLSQPQGKCYVTTWPTLQRRVWSIGQLKHTCREFAFFTYRKVRIILGWNNYNNQFFSVLTANMINWNIAWCKF